MIFLVHGECLKKLKGLDNDSVDALITDPPAGISFMNKSWDDDKGGRDSWIKWMSEIMAECLRVMKPGAHGLVWAIPRTSHWTATALEDAGFEVRDIVTHLFGSGFPKSLNISKAIDKEAGVEREVIGTRPLQGHAKQMRSKNIFEPQGEVVSEYQFTAPATAEAKKYDGFGTALKPASEHWVLIRKPLSEKTVAKNVLKYGTGGINIDDCRINTENKLGRNNKDSNGWKNSSGGDSTNIIREKQGLEQLGRFPANLVLSHNHDCEYIGTKEVKTNKTSKDTESTSWKQSSKITTNLRYVDENGKETVSDYKCTEGCAVAALDEQSGVLKSGSIIQGQICKPRVAKSKGAEKERILNKRDSSEGGASRFFYCSKAPKSDKGEDNNHPTPKNTKLMEYLITLITPEEGIVLDPFMGSGSTGIACINLKKEFIGIEKELEYFKISETRAKKLSEDVFCF